MPLAILLIAVFYSLFYISKADYVSEPGTQEVMFGLIGSILGIFGLTYSIDLPFLYRLMLSMTITAVAVLDII